MLVESAIVAFLVATFVIYMGLPRNPWTLPEGLKASRKLNAIVGRLELIEKLLDSRTYYATPHGQKLHMSPDCEALAKSGPTAELVEIPVTAQVEEFLERGKAFCSRCVDE